MISDGLRDSIQNDVLRVGMVKAAFREHSSANGMALANDDDLKRVFGFTAPFGPHPDTVVIAEFRDPRDETPERPGFQVVAVYAADFREEKLTEIAKPHWADRLAWVLAGTTPELIHLAGEQHG